MDFRDILTKKMEAQGTPVSNQGTPEDRNRQLKRSDGLCVRIPRNRCVLWRILHISPTCSGEWLFDEGGIANREA
jgi:hypothetical protein